jgi:hypothetical protein
VLFNGNLLVGKGYTAQATKTSDSQPLEVPIGLRTSAERPREDGSVRPPNRAVEVHKPATGPRAPGTGRLVHALLVRAAPEEPCHERSHQLPGRGNKAPFGGF